MSSHSDETTTNLALSCLCGNVTGALKNAGPATGDHVICHCSDCRRYAHLLDQDARILDANGGSALFAARCASLQLWTGRDSLRCVHLTDKPTLRWYAACCRTPMFNTYANGRIPYLTAIVANLDSERREQVLGPPIGLLSIDQAKSGFGTDPKLFVLRFIFGVLIRMAKDIVSGDRRRSPLFDSRSLAPISKPQRLDPSVTKIA